MNEKIKELVRKSGLHSIGSQNDIFVEKLVQLVAEDCAGICEEMGTAVAGCSGGVPTKIADDCADWIRKDFGIT